MVSWRMDRGLALFGPFFSESTHEQSGRFTFGSVTPAEWKGSAFGMGGHVVESARRWSRAPRNGRAGLRAGGRRGAARIHDGGRRVVDRQLKRYRFCGALLFPARRGRGYRR